MKNKLFNNLLLFSLFGITLGFFGMLYEGVVLGPKMLDSSMQRMLFWHDFYSVINPIVFYIPLVPLATITLVILYFMTPKLKTELKKRLGVATSLAQASACALLEHKANKKRQSLSALFHYIFATPFLFPSSYCNS